MARKRSKEIIWSDLSSLILPTVEDFTLDIPPIDEILSAIYKFRKRRVLEILGMTSCCGRSSLLYLLAGIASLPVSCGGRGGSAVLIDCDERFDARRLRDVLSCHAKARIVPGPVDVEEEVLRAMSHIHVFRPTSGEEFLATLKGLGKYFFDPGNGSTSRELCFVLVDGFGRFYFEEQLTCSITPAEANGGLYAEIVTALQAVQQAFHIPIIVTNNGELMFPHSSPSPYFPERLTGYRTYLPAIWTAFVGVRIALTRSSADPFPAEFSVQQAWESQKERLERIRRGRIEGWVDFNGLGGGVQRDIGKLKGRGGFVFYVEKGVVFE